MTLIEVVGSIIGVVLAVAAAFAAIGYYRQGSNQARLDDGNSELNTNALLKEQIDALENKVDRQSSEIQDLTKKVQFLTTSLEEERKKFAETILTLQGKDPQMTEFVTMMKAYIDMNRPLLDKINHEVVPTVERLGKFLDKQSF